MSLVHLDLTGRLVLWLAVGPIVGADRSSIPWSYGQTRAAGMKQWGGGFRMPVKKLPAFGIGLDGLFDPCLFITHLHLLSENRKISPDDGHSVISHLTHLECR